jgi:hypothetical protein
MKPRNSPLILVIDALDECDREAGREGGDLLPLLASSIRSHHGFIKLLITSREEPSISSMFRDIQSQQAKHTTVQLHNLDRNIVSADIRRFLEHRLRVIARKCSVEDENWPSQDLIAELVRRAGVLFVYAATIVRYLDDENWDPVVRLQQLLDAEAEGSFTPGSYHLLDQLYAEVFSKAVESHEVDNSALCTRLRNVVGAIVLLQDQLGRRALAGLLHIGPRDVLLVIRKLSAVLIIPETETGPIKIFHPSFPDYVSLRCSDERFRIDNSIQHGILAHHCLSIMNRQLHRDMCQTNDTSLMNSEIPVLKERFHDFIPTELQYACKHWINHLVLSSRPGLDLTSELELFCTSHLLHWVEVLSLSCAIPSAVAAIPGALRWCRVSLATMNTKIHDFTFTLGPS